MTEPSLKHKVESVLFSAGKYLPVREIAQLCGRNTRVDSVLRALKELQEEYEQKESSLMVATDGENWKLTVREAYSPIVRRIVSTTELPKSVMETLAVIAYKAPVLQSEVIRIRTNKAYDHIKELQEAGFITRRPEGRTKRIDLAQKFFDYFDLPPEDLQKRFARIKELDEHVSLLEGAADERKREHADKSAEVKEYEEKMKEEFERTAEELERDLESHPKVSFLTHKGEAEILEEYSGMPSEHLGKLEIVDTKPEPFDPDSKEWGSLSIVDMNKSDRPKLDGFGNSDESLTDENAKPDESLGDREAPNQDSDHIHVDVPELKGSDRLRLPEGSDKAVDARIDELLNPQKEVERKKRELEARAKRLEEGPIEKKEEVEEEQRAEEQKKEVAPEDKEADVPSEEVVKKKVEEKESGPTESDAEEKEEPEEPKEEPEEPKEESHLDEVSDAMKDIK